jgi:hypothetical protein
MTDTTRMSVREATTRKEPHVLTWRGDRRALLADPGAHIRQIETAALRKLQRIGGGDGLRALIGAG